jgi:hypothetical protein
VSGRAARGTVLGLEVADRREALGLALLLGLYFALSGSRDLSFYDSAELALVAGQGGLGHPIGQPLHTMLGGLVTALPGLDAASTLWLLNLLSAVPAGLCAVPALALAFQSGARPWLGGGLVFVGLTHLVFWETATRVEVYTLAAFFALWAMARLGELAHGRVALTLRQGLKVGVALGLAASANAHVAVIAAVSAGLPALHAQRTTPGLLRAVGGVVLGGLAGLLCFLYVPWATTRDASVFVWGGDDLGRYFLGLDYARNRVLDAESWAEKGARLVAWSHQAAVWATLGLGTLGALGRGAGRIATAGATGWALTTLLVMSNSTYLPENTDYYGYLAAPWAVLVAQAAGVVSRLWTEGERRWVAVAGAGAIGLCVLVAHPGPIARTRFHDTAARQLATEVLENAPPRALVFVSSDHFVWPMHALQALEGLRPDVVVLADGLLDSSWYWRWTFARHADLVPVELGGSHVDRVRRFAAAQGERPMLFERGPLSALVGGPVCADRLFARRPPCPEDLDRAAGAGLIAALMDRVGAGSPTTDEALAQVAFDRGDLLWTLGHARDALDAYLAGVPADDRRLVDLPAGAPLDAPPLRRLPPEWRQVRPLGRPERNLFRAAELLHAAGDDTAATRLLTRAAELGLSEAQ